MSFVSGLLPALDAIRAIPGSLGLHPFTVTRVVRTWASGTIGHGAVTSTSTVLKVGGQNVHARQATQSEVEHVLGDGTLWAEGDWLIGPLTPEFTGGGYDADDFDSPDGTAKQILYTIEGPGMSSDNTFLAVRKSTDNPLRITVLLRRAPFV